MSRTRSSRRAGLLQSADAALLIPSDLSQHHWLPKKEISPADVSSNRRRACPYSKKRAGRPEVRRGPNFVSSLTIFLTIAAGCGPIGAPIWAAEGFMIDVQGVALFLSARPARHSQLLEFFSPHRRNCAHWGPFARRRFDSCYIPVVSFVPSRRLSRTRTVPTVPFSPTSATLSAPHRERQNPKRLGAPLPCFRRVTRTGGAPR